MLKNPFQRCSNKQQPEIYSHVAWSHYHISTSGTCAAVPVVKIGLRMTFSDFVVEITFNVTEVSTLCAVKRVLLHYNKHLIIKDVASYMNCCYLYSVNNQEDCLFTASP